MKGKIFWTGSERHCRALIEEYPGAAEHEYVKKATASFLNRHAKECLAVVLVPYGDFIGDIELYNVVGSFSARKRKPVLFTGDEQQFYTAFSQCPGALFYKAGADDLPEAFKMSMESVKTDVAVCSFDPSYFAYCEEMAEKGGITNVRFVYCTTYGGCARLLREGRMKPALFILCGIAARGNITRRMGIKDVPLLVLTCSDDEGVYSGLDPIAVIDVSGDSDELIKYLADV